MSGTGGYAVSRRNGGDGLYNPPAAERFQQMLFPKQQFMQMAAAANVTNLDRLRETLTIIIPSRNSTEVNASRSKMQEAESVPFYYFEDLCESLTMWSLYGAGVPFLLNGQDLVTQYYVPYLSGIQLYVDPSKPLSDLRPKPGEKFLYGSLWLYGNCISLYSCTGLYLQLLYSKGNEIFTYKWKPGEEKAEISSSPGLLILEYLEQEKPWLRKPLSEQLEALASRFDLKQCRSCDLLPSSWISIAWYPIYRIPIGPVLGDLEASFLTFHSLSTQAANASKDRGVVDSPSKISLPVFGLASFKLRGSILSPREPHECKQEGSLWQAAESWLQHLRVDLPDFQFYRARYPRQR